MRDLRHKVTAEGFDAVCKRLMASIRRREASTPDPVDCPYCGRRWDGDVEGRVCPACRKQVAAKELEAAWKRLCPPDYRKTDPARLNQDALARVMAWEYGPRGLLLVGPTDQGKTRTMYLLLRRLLEQGLRVEAFEPLGFGHACQRHFTRGTGPDWFDGLVAADVVFFDDLGKEPMTPRVEAELYGVVERRAARERPILATTNMTGARLVRAASEDRGAPLVRRLREFCEVMVFGKEANDEQA